MVKNEAYWCLKIVFTLVGLFVVLDTVYPDSEDQPTTEKEVPTHKKKKGKKSRKEELDTQMREAIKAHNVDKISTLLDKHNTSERPKNKRDKKAYRRFIKGLYGGWDWELFKQLAPRLVITFVWNQLFNPFYCLSNHSSSFDFLKIPLRLVRYGFNAFLYLKQFIGGNIETDKLAQEKLNKAMSLFSVYLTWVNILYMCYRICNDIKAPSYLMMILASDKFTPKEKKDLQKLFYTKLSAGKKTQYKPPAMQTYGIICTQHKEAESIEEEFLTKLEANIKQMEEEKQPRGLEWLLLVFLRRKLVYRILRACIYYSGLTITYIELPATSGDTYKIATYTDSVKLGKKEYTKSAPNGQTSIDELKLLLKIGPLMWALILHSGLPGEYQVPDQAN